MIIGNQKCVLQALVLSPEISGKAIFLNRGPVDEGGMEKRLQSKRQKMSSVSCLSNCKPESSTFRVTNRKFCEVAYKTSLEHSKTCSSMRAG